MNSTVPTQTTWDVIVWGDSLLAVWASHLLAQRGVDVLRIHEHAVGSIGTLEEMALPLAWSTLSDPPTRALVAHGKEVADFLCSFVAHGAQQWAQASTEHGGPGGVPAGRMAISVSRVPNVRMARAAHEKRELTQAALAFPFLVPQGVVAGSEGAALSDNDKSPLALWSEPESFVLETSGGSALSSLAECEAADRRVQSRVVAIEESSQNVTIRCANGPIFTAEMAVVAQGADIGRVCPRFESVLIPMTNVAVSVDVPMGASSATTAPINAALSFRTSNGHVQGLVRADAPNRRWVFEMTGPRYALHHAGAGWWPHEVQADGTLAQGRLALAHAPWSQGVASTCCDALLALGEPPESAKICMRDLSERLSQGQFRQRLVVGALPCDELPLVGEFGTQGRVLGSAGWLGVELTVALPIAESLTERILGQQSRRDELHPMLSPKRLQSMS